MIFKPFLSTAMPQIEQLETLHTDLQRELASLLAYFGEKSGGDGAKPEDLFGTILGFSAGLQKAAVEMTRHVVKEDKGYKGRIKAIPAKAKDAIPTIRSSNASTLKAAAASSASSLLPSMEVQSVSQATVRSIRGTMSRGDLDEAIRSIHGGVRRRERKDGTVGRGGGVRLSKMFLDGGGSVRVKAGVSGISGLGG